MKKKMRLASLLVASIIVFSALFGCKGEENVSSVVSSEMPSSSDSSEPAPSEPSSLAPESGSSSSGQSSSEEPYVGGEEVTTIVTNDKEFNKVFAENPIDKAYKEEMQNAASNVDMLEVAEKYVGIWQKEIESGFKKLMATKAPQDKKDSFQAKQTSWEQDSPAALEKIAADAQALGGSMAQVEIAGQTMEHYRARAAAIYKNLYAYDKKFKYAFTAS